MCSSGPWTCNFSVVQDGGKGLAFVNTVMNLRILWIAGNFFASWSLLASKEKPFCMKKIN